MEKAAVYIRVSTEEQTEYSPEAQKRALWEYAVKNGYEVSEEFLFADEGISGRRAEKRPAFMKMIAMAKQKPRPFDAILVHKFDRFARNREDSVVYKSLLRKECGIKVISITEQMEDDKFSIILESILEAMAEYYSLNLSDEVKKGMFEKARHGEHIGPAPYGYCCKEGKLIPQDQEQIILKEIFNLYVYENYSLSAIAHRLNDQSIYGKNGGKWTVKTLSYILSNPVYTGATRYNYRPRGAKEANGKEKLIYGEGTHLPLISKETFRLSEQKISQSKKTVNYNNQALKSWAQHLFICPCCKKPMTVSTSQGKYASFRCTQSSKGNCANKKSISVKKAEMLIACKLDTIAVFPPIAVCKIKSQSSMMPFYEKKIKDSEKQLELARQAYLKGADTYTEYEQSKKTITGEIREMQSLIEKEMKKEGLENPLCFASFSEILLSDKLSTTEKHSFLSSFVKFIEIIEEDAMTINVEK